MFLIHRYRCAYECLEIEQNSEKQKIVSAKYKKYLAQAKNDPDILIQAIAADLDAAGYIPTR